MTDTSAVARALEEELARNLERARLLAATLAEIQTDGLKRATTERIRNGATDLCAAARSLLDETPVDDRPDLRVDWCSTCSWRQTHRWLRGEWVCVYCGTALVVTARRPLAVVQGGAA